MHGFWRGGRGTSLIPQLSVNTVAKQANDDARAAFVKTGLSLVENETLVCSGLAVFDHRCVWYGTIPLLAFPRTDDCSIRFESAEAARDLLEGLGLEGLISAEVSAEH